MTTPDIAYGPIQQFYSAAIEQSYETKIIELKLVGVRVSPSLHTLLSRSISTDQTNTSALTFRGCPVTIDLPDSHQPGFVFCYEA